MEILLLLGIYLVELLCYQIVLRMLFQMKVTTKKWMILGAGLQIVIGVLPVNMAGKIFLVTFSSFCIMLISFSGKIAEIIIRLVLSLLLMACIEDIVIYPFEKLFDINYLSCLCAKGCTFMIVLLMYNLKQKFGVLKSIHINSAIYFIIGVFILLMLFCLGILNQVSTYFPNSRYVMLCNILNITIIVSIFLLAMFVIYIKQTHERMEQLLKTEKLLKESQVNYYKQILKKEVDTRKYRHDMINHLVYVQEILNQNRIDDAQQYLANILGGFKKIQSSYYTTGNEMLDTIMNYFFGMLSSNVRIEIKGKCPVVFDMEDTDVCTIFSNVFQNAVEEILENNIKKASIVVEVCKGQQYVEYKIKNTLFTEIDNSCIDKCGLPKSRKSDKLNHGIGMVNMKSTVERNHGKFEWYQNEGYFGVRIILPIK